MQFKLHISLLLSLLVCYSSVFSQKAKSESVSSVYFSVPTYDIATTDPGTLRYSFAMGRTSFGPPKSFETENVCVPSNSKNVLKDAKKIKVYQFSIPAEIQESYLVIETPGGDVLYSEELYAYKKTSSFVNETIELFYGEGKCYWLPQLLKEAWKEDQAEWKEKQHEKIRAHVFEKAQKSARAAFKFGYANHSVNVYTGKGGKAYDYSELDEAQKQAVAAYDRMATGSVINQRSIDQLMVPVDTWLRYTEQINLEDKKAMINGKIARGLYMNLATAYFQMRDFEKAMKYLDLHGNTYSNAMNRGNDQEVINLSNLIMEQQRGMEANPGLSNDFTALNEKARATGPAYIQVRDVGEGMVNELSARHHFYTKDAKKQADIAASGGNVYKSNINQGMHGPTLVMMTIFDGDWEEFPVEITELDVNGLVLTGGYSFTSIPPEIGNMTNLVYINLTGSAVSSIPDEIGKLTNLKRLNLSGTQITSLPESIKNLQNLEMLNIKKTNISAAESEKIKSWVPAGCKLKL